MIIYILTNINIEYIIVSMTWTSDKTYMSNLAVLVAFIVIYIDLITLFVFYLQEILVF